MEREKEITKLVNVLRRIARGASYAAFNNVAPDAAPFCAAQYNRVLARLRQIEPQLAQLYAPLPESASAAVTNMSARELAAYFEDETTPAPGRHRRYGCGPRVVVGWAPLSRRCE
jgi:uncharacterized membrane protein YccC